jgi:hypothetical protein
MLRPQLSSEVLLPEVEGSGEISGKRETGDFLMTRVYIQCIYARTIVFSNSRNRNSFYYFRQFDRNEGQVIPETFVPVGVK